LDRVNGLPPKVSLAALVIDNDALEVLAYAGSADFNDRERAAHVDMVRGVRSPGSTLKPFLYAMALDEGLVHSESLLIDAPQSFGGYQPGNFQASFSGPVSVSEALQKSLNVPAVDLLDRVGPARFASQLRAAGIRLRMARGVEPNLSLILGGAGTTLEELVGGYRALARAGLAGRPRLQPEEPRIESRLMSEGAAFIVRDILEGGGHPDRPFVEGARGLAWKTGTSFGFRDAWAVGVTGRHTIGVWVGRPDGTPNPGFFGANTAAPLLQDIASALQEPASAARTPPVTVSRSLICWPMGMRKEATPPEQCLSQRTAWLLQGTSPPTLPDRYRTGGLLVMCQPGRPHVRWPAALAPWVREADCRAPSQDSQLRIEGLDAGALLKPVPGHPQVSVTVSAAGAASPSDRLYWLLDGVQVRRAMAREAVTLNLDTAGLHALTLLDETGRFQRIEFRLAAP
ncbi:MAG TPA: penicillin-binding transpeptidase domain-containing protein, partial [Burkholderiaceae bacterium]|nr:penicillin-binding transpeptidase domain-containing protein [Burkholderiaceae bacterium]